MKKPTTWAAIIGGILTAGFLFNLAKSITQPTPMAGMNTALIASNLVWLAFSVFLVVLFFRGKNKEDAAAHSPQAQVSDDATRLATRRDWILIFVILLEIVGSVESWVLTPFVAGIKSQMALFTFIDIAINLVFLYCVVQLLRGNRQVFSLMLYAAVAEGLVTACYEAIIHHWWIVPVPMLFSLYIVYTIMAPVNRSSFRIATFALLPLYVVGSVALGMFDSRVIQQLGEKEVVLEQQFAVIDGRAGENYEAFKKKEGTDKVLNSDFRTNLVERDKKIGELQDLYSDMIRENSNQLPSVAQQKLLMKLGYWKKMLTLYTESDAVLNKMLDYSDSVSTRTYTDAQKEKFSEMTKQLDGYNEALANLNAEATNAHIDF